MNSSMQSALDQRRAKGNLRLLRSPPGLIDFASNDYLGFAKRTELHDALMDQKKIGSTGSRLLTGHTDFIEEIEQEIAVFHRAEAGLIFNSGYTANLGLIASIAQAGDTILSDSEIHASTRDGLRLSKAACFFWRHQDLDHLKTRLKRCCGRTFVCVESIYSCDGSSAPLLEICDLCSQHGAFLIVDEAHATGIAGEDGRGAVCLYNCEDRVFARVHTFSKALGIGGAIVLGSTKLKEYLINFSRPFIYSSAMPFPIFSGIKASYELLKKSHRLIEHLRHLIQYFRQKVSEAKLPFFPSSSPIQSLIIAGNQQALSAAADFEKQGIDVRALLSPTVPCGKERLRFCLHVYNTFQEIDRLFAMVSQYA